MSNDRRGRQLTYSDEHARMTQRDRDRAWDELTEGLLEIARNDPEFARRLVEVLSRPSSPC